MQLYRNTLFFLFCFFALSMFTTFGLFEVESFRNKGSW